MFIYPLIYILSLYLSSKLSDTPISIREFIDNFSENYPSKSKTKKIFYILRNLRILFLNSNNLNALKFVSIYSFAACQYDKVMLLVSQAIGSGHYHSSILDYLKSNPHLLTIAVDPQTLSHLDYFSNLQQSDIPLIVTKINRDILSSHDENIIITQIPKLISLLFINNKIDYVEYIKVLLNFIRGQGLSTKIKLLLKELVIDHKIIFKFSFIDFF